MNIRELYDLKEVLKQAKQKEIMQLWGGLKPTKDASKREEEKTLKTKNQANEYKAGLTQLFDESEGNIGKGILFIRKSARQGYAKSLNTYGSLYLIGLFVKRDFSLALDKLSLAKERGSNEALFWLGIYHLSQANNKQPDPAKARELHDEAIKQGIDEVYVAKIKELEAAGEYEC